MEIKVSNKIGFCYGVKRAFEESLNIVKSENKKVYIYGELVHNKDVINKLLDSGLYVFTDINNIPNDSNESVAIIRAHGIPNTERQILENNFSKVIDMTCPIVNQMVNYASNKQQEGYYISVFGKENHPEMICLKGNVDQEKIKISLKPFEIDKNKVCILSQTTVDNESFKDFYVEMIRLNNFSDIIVKNTICAETSIREKDAYELSKWADFVIIIGGKNSSNTKKLHKISSKFCENSIHIENYLELKNINIHKFNKIAVLTGSSTPSWVIDETLEYLKK